MRTNIEVYKEKKTVIFRQGDTGCWMYDILEGRVGIYVGYGTPEEKELAVLLPGQCFGEMGLIEHLPRSATAVTLTEYTRLQRIGEPEFLEYFTERTDKLMDIMQNISNRIRDLTDDYRNVCQTIAETVEAEEDEAKRITFREKFRKFTEDHFRLSGRQ